MIRLRHDNLSMPALNTASLPDLIFTVLFFFMIVTHMRKATIKVEYTLPQGKELTRLTKKSAVTYIYIGHMSRQDSNGNATTDDVIQLNDKIATTDDIADYIAAEKQRMSPDDQARMTVSVKADRHTPMSLINDVKRAIRAGGATRINYSADSFSDNLKEK